AGLVRCGGRDRARAGRWGARPAGARGRAPGPRARAPPDRAPRGAAAGAGRAPLRPLPAHRPRSARGVSARSSLGRWPQRRPGGLDPDRPLRRRVPVAGEDVYGDESAEGPEQRRQRCQLHAHGVALLSTAWHNATAMPPGARAKGRGARACTLEPASFCPFAVSPNRTAAVASLQNTRSRARPRAERRMLRKASIPALRQQIDRIDDQLLRLLNRRAALALAVAEQKARSNSGVYAPAREKGVLERLVRANRGPLPVQLVRAIFREIISASRSLEQRLRIAYLGPEATFAHLAARQQFGAAADYLGAPSIADVFHEVESGRAGARGGGDRRDRRRGRRGDLQSRRPLPRDQRRAR